MTTTPGYTVDALRHALEETDFLADWQRDMILARTALDNARKVIGACHD